MEIIVTISVEDDSIIDAKHETGLTEAGYLDLCKRLGGTFSVQDVEVKP